MAALEPKTQVNQFCQKKLGRQVTKTDITYSTQKHGNSYQATVSLPCLGGVAFVGELVGTAKGAESAAAAQVLTHYAAEIQALANMPKEKKATGTKRPASAMGGVGIAGPSDKVQKIDGDQTPSGPVPPKKEVNEICMKICRRMLTKGEITYNSGKVAGGFQSTLQLSCLPGVYGQNLFTGTVCSNKKDAEVSVATIAIQTLKADAELAELINKPKEPSKGKGKGKGKGKSKNFDPALYKTKMCTNFQEGTCNRGENCSFAHDESELQEKPKWENNDWGGEDFDPMMAMMIMMMGAAGGGGDGKKKDKGKRERVSTAKVSGTVEDWKGSMGWIKPATPFAHEKASMHNGKIYLAKSDVPKGTEVKKGMTLTFHVYADKSGLGAEDVSA
eukprot:gnl/MRDRNA2_/MRDRNA2_100993_c0_seq1.p1 gnl/MRDRNA2_/MRDRNA2_100993_c0~~gnl/MRDRNA2_/MRDRNA2_100993_c0_seq1.p1  ORF type:complete len:388 (-),score=98.73 gnl/MRDRNA2_/MRDRNA2_100993_c0_seq1:196-1359(-)